VKRGLRAGVGLAAVLAAVALAGCGDDGDGGGGGRITTTTDLPGGLLPDINGDKDQEKRVGGFTGRDASNYKAAKSNCRLEGWLPEGEDQRQAADDYASLFPPPRRQAVLEGCLAGIEGE